MTVAGLDAKVRLALEQQHHRLEAAGELLSREALERYFRHFSDTFGPPVLQALDGVELLERIHAHGRQDSLVYWLEFKDDEEFPSTRLGGIGGGSALKFGIYRRRETGEWTVGSSQEQRSVSIEEAIRIARTHRDQLVAAAEVLQTWSRDLSDEAYAELQGRIEQVAPDVQDTVWGHKYLSLLFPDKLDDYHVAAYQRFQLMKLGQVPPVASGRYASAGRFVALTLDLGWPLHQLTRVLNTLHGRPYRYWRVGTSDGREPKKYWPLMRDTRVAAIGWPAVGDLSLFVNGPDARERLRQRLQETYPGLPQKIGNDIQQLMNFCQAMKLGDVVVAAQGATVLGIGRVKGPYRYEPGADFPHQLPVEWLDVGEWKLPEPEGLQSTVRELKKYPVNLVEIERRLFSSPVVPPPPPILPDPRPPMTRLEGILSAIENALERKGQVILYGPPGTGKTHWAEKAAKDLAAGHAFGRRYDDLSPEQQHEVWAPGGDGLVRICTFHPSYGYEDFLEGHRPDVVQNQLTFQLRDGLFKRICLDAERRSDRRYYLLIDEINRGDIPRIFGELLTVLERSKRSWPIVLPLSGKPFSVPPNLYVIGTMNTADRSIALLDTALRRRFAFIELMPNSATLGDVVIEGIPLALWLDSLNQRIRETIGRDARNLQLGHAYLLRDGAPLADLNGFRRVLAEDVLPLLEEYCYDDWEKLQGILGPGLVDMTGQRIRWELFELAREDDLVQAILSMDPDLGASTQAVTADQRAAEPATDEDDAEDEASGEVGSRA